MVTRELLVAGGGIGGLATAVAATRAGWAVRLFEQAAAFSEVGAGIQLGPNATRVLQGWNLLEAVRACAWAPAGLRVRDAHDGRELAALPLGSDVERRYGAPYLTVHRADLHELLLQAAGGAGASLQTGVRATGFEAAAGAVRLHLATGSAPEGDALVAADGLWSPLRRQLLADGPPQPSDHVAYRGLVPAGALPAAWRTAGVTAWLGPRLHAVTYPVRRGEQINVVCVVQEHIAGDPSGWDHAATAARLRERMGPVCAPLREVLDAAPGWRLWVLHDRAVVRGPGAMAQGPVALLGDAAHPMRPYLAQGAAMAIEDAAEMGRCLAMVSDRVADTDLALRRYALARWERCAAVQRRSLRNARIFHATGPVRVARDLSLAVLGRRLMDMPWLWGRGAAPAPA